jgi:amino acid transporter
MSNKQGFGTAPVFFTAIATILGAILFLRFGWATGTLGFWGVILIILLGHMVTIPTALALSEIATNQKVEGGGEYFIISRSFGLNIGGAIGLALYFSQAISVAFYVIAFTEAFSPLFEWLKDAHGLDLPRQVISIPMMLALSWLILTKGANMGVKALYIVVGVLVVSLALFFLGQPEYQGIQNFKLLKFDFKNMDQFFVVFAIIFPAFTGMTAGVGLSGDLKNPRKSIPWGTVSATLIGVVIYMFIAYKFKIGASSGSLTNNQMVMGEIALGGLPFVLLGLAASTLSSALGSVMVAPRTLQALAMDKSIPIPGIAGFLSKGKGESNEPFNASLITCIIALVFVAMGSVDAVGKIISMFFMITYGSLNLISFLFHFGGDPSYRPAFRTNRYVSFLGFVMSMWLMIKIDFLYTLIAFVFMIGIYLLLSRMHKDRKGIESIFQGAVYQLAMRIRMFVQKSKHAMDNQKWRPSVVCVSPDSFERSNAFNFLNWISYRYGYGTYIHLVRGYFNHENKEKADLQVDRLLERYMKHKHHVYISSMISPSYTSAIAQLVQLPGVSGMANNMVLFEYHRDNPDDLKQILENYPLVEAAEQNTGILSSSNKATIYKNDIHIWIRPTDSTNANLMILMAYTILGHPQWKKARVKVFYLSSGEELDQNRSELLDLIEEGRIPITKNNVEVLESTSDDPRGLKLIHKHSAKAGFIITGFRGKDIQDEEGELFDGLDDLGDVLFIHSHKQVSMK